jgi:preprotein translocase subunit YajC
MSNMSPMLMMLVIFGIFYFLMIRPQVKKQKEHQAMLGKLGKGDEVITRGGLIGKISGVSDDNTVLVIELQDKVRVRILRSYVEGRWAPAAKPAESVVKSSDSAKSESAA